MRSVYIGEATRLSQAYDCRVLINGTASIRQTILSRALNQATYRADLEAPIELFHQSIWKHECR